MSTVPNLIDVKGQVGALNEGDRFSMLLRYHRFEFYVISVESDGTIQFGDGDRFLSGTVMRLINAGFRYEGPPIKVENRFAISGNYPPSASEYDFTKDPDDLIFLDQLKKRGWSAMKNSFPTDMDMSDLLEERLRRLTIHSEV